MKSINQYIAEKLIIKKRKYNYFPKTKKELKNIITQRIKENGNEVDLNDIDVSNITDMSGLFYKFYYFNGDISDWDVSNVTDMNSMFDNCKSFNRDISSWDVSNVNYNPYNIFFNCPIEEKYKSKFK